MTPGSGTGTPDRTSQAGPILLAIVLASAAALRFWGLGFGLPHDLARPDEEKIILAALGVVHGDPNPHLFLYPSLFIYLTAALFVLASAVAVPMATATEYASRLVTDPSLLHFVPRALSAAMGVATIAVLYASARQLFSRRVAIAAATFLAVAFLHVRDSHFGTTDVAAAFMTMCAFWAGARCATRGATAGRIVATGLLCGLAASTKYNAVLVAAPAALAVAGDALLLRRRPTLRDIGVLGLLAGCLVVGFTATTPYAVLDYRGFLAGFGEQSRIFAGTQLGSIIGPARAAYGGQHGWTHYLLFTLRYGVGLPLLIASLTGAAWLLARRPRTGLLVLSFPVAYYAAMGAGQLVYARNMVPVVPFLCLAAGVLVDRLVSLGTRRTKDFPPLRRAADVAAVVLVAAVAAPTAAASIAFDRLVARADTRVLAARWVEQKFPKGATIGQTGILYGHLQPQPSGAYPEVRFDERAGRFRARGSPDVLPQIVVCLHSPLDVYDAVPARLDPILQSTYVLAQVFAATPRGGAFEGVYDRQDAFYVPFAKLASVARPGPGIYIYVRRNQPPGAGQ